MFKKISKAAIGNALGQMHKLFEHAGKRLLSISIDSNPIVCQLGIFCLNTNITLYPSMSPSDSFGIKTEELVKVREFFVKYPYLKKEYIMLFS